MGQREIILYTIRKGNYSRKYRISPQSYCPTDIYMCFIYLQTTYIYALYMCTLMVKHVFGRATFRLIIYVARDSTIKIFAEVRWFSELNTLMSCVLFVVAVKWSETSTLEKCYIANRRKERVALHPGSARVV